MHLQHQLQVISFSTLWQCLKFPDTTSSLYLIPWCHSSVDSRCLRLSYIRPCVIYPAKVEICFAPIFCSYCWSRLTLHAINMLIPRQILVPPPVQPSLLDAELLMLLLCSILALDILGALRRRPVNVTWFSI